MTSSCCNCEAVREVEIVDVEETVTMKGVEVTFTARVTRCTTCGTEFETCGQLDANLNAARRAYKEKTDQQSLKTCLPQE